MADHSPELCGWYSEIASEYVRTQVWLTPGGKEVRATEVGQCAGFAPAWLSSSSVGPVARCLRVEWSERAQEHIAGRHRAEQLEWQTLFDSTQAK